MGRVLSGEGGGAHASPMEAEPASHGAPTYDVLGLWVLALCRGWPALSSAEGSALTPTLIDGLKKLRGGPDGLYVPVGAVHARAAWQAGAIAALRCGSAVLDAPSFAVDAEAGLRALHSLYLPPPEYGGGWIVPPPFALSGGDLAKRAPGLSKMLASPGSRPSPELAQLLLFLEPGDLPQAVLGRLAASLASLETPVGLSHGEDGALSPVAQAVALLGAVKHVLALEGGGGERQDLAPAGDVMDDLSDEMGGGSPDPVDDGSAWRAIDEYAAEEEAAEAEAERAAAEAEAGGVYGEGPLLDLLTDVMEAALRVAPLLEQLEAEAGGRTAARDIAAVLGRALRATPTPVGGEALAALGLHPSAPSGAAPEADTFARLAAAAHRLTFPELLVPLSPSDPTPLKPGLAAPILPAWTLLKNTAMDKLVASKLGGYAVQVVAGNRTRSLRSGLAAAGGGAGKAVGKLLELFYPEGGLRVVRLPVTGGESAKGAPDRVVEQVVVRSGAKRPSVLSQAVAALGRTVLRITPTPAPLAPVSTSGGSDGSFFRGAGHPLSLPTVVTARLLRQVYGAARSITAARAAGRLAAEPGAPPLARVKSALAIAFRTRVVQPSREDVNSVLTSPFAGVLLGVNGSLGDAVTWLDASSRRAAASAMDARLVSAAEAAEAAAAAATPPPPAPAEPGFLSPQGVDPDVVAPDDPRWVGRMKPLGGEMPADVYGDVLDAPGALDADVLVKAPRPSHAPFMPVPEEGEARAVPVPEVGEAEAAARPTSDGDDAPPPAAFVKRSGEKPRSVDVIALFSKICPLDAADTLFRPWAAECCGEALSALVIAAADDSSTARMVSVDALPTFTCARVPGVGDAVLGPVRRPISCGAVGDGFCDCSWDGGDEHGLSGACASSTRQVGVFYCPSGVRVVGHGELGEAPHGAVSTPPPLAQLFVGVPPASLAAWGYLPASKVGDGVQDCVGGEDEAKGEAGASN